MKVENEKFTFDSGKTIYANHGLIGISEEMVSGVDEVIEISGLTTDEKIELARYMVNLWKRFKVRLIVEKLRSLR